MIFRTLKDPNQSWKNIFLNWILDGKMKPNQMLTEVNISLRESPDA